MCSAQQFQVQGPTDEHHLLDRAVYGGRRQYDDRCPSRFGSTELGAKWARSGEMVRALASASVNESQVTIVSLPRDQMATGLAKGDADALDVMKQEETWVARNQKRGSRRARP